MFCDVISVTIKNIQLNTDNKIESYVKKKKRINFKNTNYNIICLKINRKKSKFIYFK